MKRLQWLAVGMFLTLILAMVILAHIAAVYGELGP
jgi:hypothetical protein